MVYQGMPGRYMEFSEAAIATLFQSLQENLALLLSSQQIRNMLFGGIDLCSTFAAVVYYVFACTDRLVLS